MNFKRSMLGSLALTVLLIGSANSQFTHRTETTRSEVTCIATASAKSIKFSNDAIVIAVAAAFDTACKGGGGRDYIKRVERAYYGYANVYAKAITDATASCATSGNAFGCAAATSYARSIAKATAAAFASAVAKAAAGCGCVPHVQTAALAKAFGTAASFIKLTARASSTVSAHVCASHGQSANASIHQVCLASATARVFAKATAEALAQRSCYTADAYAKIKAVTEIKTYITEGCVKNSSTGGNGQSGTGSNGSGVVDVKDFLKKVKGRR